jgi:hypothetical protein
MSEQFSGRVTIVDGSQREVFAFDSAFAVLDLGAQGNEGDLRVRGDDGAPKIHLDGGRQLVNVTNAAGVTVLRFDASHSLLDLGPSLGGAGAEADLRIFGSDGQAKIHLDGQTGDIRLIGADCAEQFELEGPAGVQPGAVLTIGDGGWLRSCREALRPASGRSGLGCRPLPVGHRPGRQGRSAPSVPDRARREGLLPGRCLLRPDRRGRSPDDITDRGPCDAGLRSVQSLRRDARQGPRSLDQRLRAGADPRRAAVRT